MYNINSFDWITYLSNYEDLRKNGIKTKEKAYQHWIKFGKKEGRICNKNNKNNLNEFNWQFYITKYQDLRENRINTKERAYQHWIKFGKNEGRICNNQDIDNNITKIDIFYYVDNTCKINYNTGIQRVVRLLGQYLSTKCNLYLVKFDHTNMKFIDLTVDEKLNLQKFNGMQSIIPLNLNLENKILLIPDLIIGSTSFKQVINEARRNNMKIATIFYDDIPYLLPNIYSYEQRDKTIINIGYLFECDLIFPISYYSQSRLLFHCDKLEIRKYNKIIPIQLPAEFPNIKRNFEYNVPQNQKYHILCVSAIDIRKNQLCLVKAIDLLKDNYDIELTLVGRIINNDYYNIILNSTSKNIKYYEIVDDDKLRDLYLESHLTVFPSIEEGYGLPILESIWNCRPCICMNYGSMDEISVAGCLKINCNDINLLAKSIENILTNEIIRNKLIEEIKNNKLKSWDEYATQLLNELTKNSNDINVLYWVGFTCTTKVNTGVQRVARLLGNKLSKQINLYPIKSNTDNTDFIDLNDEELKNMENYNGMQYNITKFNHGFKNKWLLVPDFLFGPPYYNNLFNISEKYNIKIAVIFYDDLHIKNNIEYFKSLSHCDLIFPISLYSYERLLYNFSTKNIAFDFNKIIPHILPGEFPNIPRTLSYDVNSKLNDNKFRILCVSLIERRKNQISVIKAIEKLKNKYNIELLLVAGNIGHPDYYNEILELTKMNNNIKIYIDITDEQLKEFYMTSNLTVYPSIEEGYGLPIAESIWYCRPCICMNYGSMAEVSIVGCMKIDCNNTDELANMIETILTNESIRNKLIEEIRNTKIRTWEDYAKDIVFSMKPFENN